MNLDVPGQGEVGRAEQVLKERLAAEVDWVYSGPHDPRYRTQRVAEATERIWMQMEAWRRAVRAEREFGRAMAL